MRDLTDVENDFLHQEARCPFCGCEKIIEGPSGGASQNMYCGNAQSCQAQFNFSPFGVDLIQPSIIVAKDWACNGGPPLPKLSKGQILAKFVEGKRHWWQRG